MIVDIQRKAIIQYGIKLRQIEIRIRQIDTGTNIGCRITILRIKSLYQIMRRSGTGTSVVERRERRPSNRLLLKYLRKA